MKVFGFTDGGHDCSFCLLENGIPVLHVEAERHTRVKEERGDPIAFFLENYVTPSDAETIALCQYRTPHHEKFPRSYAKLPPHKAIYVGHHTCHAANAFFSSNFDTALVFTMDGGGYEDRDDITLGVYQGVDSKIKLIRLWHKTEINMGRLWSQITSKIFEMPIGPPEGHRAGTVRAMAACGDPNVFEEHFALRDGKNGFSYGYLKKAEQQGGGFDIAASLQQYTERKIKAIFDEYLIKYPNDNICLSGGCALNSVLVGKMLDWYPGKNIYVCPVPYDGGLSIGAAQHYWHHTLGKPRISWKGNCSTYLGYAYSKEDILAEVSTYKQVKDEEVINLLLQQKIISVYGGRSESGRRALGNRSILADPRNVDMKGRVNEKVKHRQWFRPFAPSVLREHMGEWFEHDIDSPYMSFALKVKEEKRSLVPAIVHVDGTARLQTVTAEDNYWYYNFLQRWYQASGVPMLLNTSFNDREPIVETPRDAVKCFRKTEIDYLYFYEYGILESKS